MKITCTELEKEWVLKKGNLIRCSPSNDCNKCLEDNIEWEIKAVSRNE